MDEKHRERLGNPDTYPAEEFAGFDGFGEFPEWQPNGKRQPDRADIERRMRNRFASEPVLENVQIDIAFEKETICLRGFVRDVTAKCAAEIIAVEVSGMDTIQNDLVIDSSRGPERLSA